MSRRALIPLALLAVLVVLTAVFAVVGATSSPSAETLAVQNASTQTFGSPTGSVSFLADLTNTVASGSSRAGTLSQQRIIEYAAPDRMAVYQVTKKGAQPIALLHQPSVSCVLSAYSSIVGGSTAWAASGHGEYTRTESLADYSARVPQTSGTACQPHPSTVRGQVSERALVRSGFLVAVRLIVVVPAQTLSNGRQAAHGVEGEELAMVEIGTRPVRTLS
jgi:hypothetical protein